MPLANAPGIEAIIALVAWSFLDTSSGKNIIVGVNSTPHFKIISFSCNVSPSKSVTSTSKKDVDASVKKVWKVSEISKLKPAQFEKFEKEIDLARKEGRIVNG